jgi:CubicO group peptidase (beta-lactamase class C family)
MILLGLLFTCTQCNAQYKYEFTYSSPESKGYSSEKLQLLKKHLIESGSSSMLIMVDGDIIFEWGETSKKHLIHSMRKATLNSLYGIAIDRGQIDTTMTLRELNIHDIEPDLSGHELNARVADLLKSRSGIYHDAAAVNNAMLHGRPERGTKKPGEYYYYNNWDFNTLGAILEQETGESIYTMFHNEIAIPLGMLDYKGEFASIDLETDKVEKPKTDGYYQFEKSLSKYPAYHFRMSTRDLALYGQLYLNYGRWNGNQIIPKEWIDASSKPYSKYDLQYGNAYGMLWRVRIPDEDTKRNSFYHTGLGIHMLGIYPDSKLVMVHRVDTEGDYKYNEGDFYKMIGLMFSARNRQ